MDASEARELSLVGKVELKIALTQSETTLESLLKTYLPPVLLKLESEHSSVRNKVISICQHLKTRLESPYVMCSLPGTKLRLSKLHSTSSSCPIEAIQRPP